MATRLLNVILQQAGWFACVLGAAHGAPVLGPAVVAGVVAAHLSLAARPVREASLILTAGLLGGLWESAIVAAGWIEYPSGTMGRNLAPYWIVAMWMLFATTLNVSLRWLRSRLGVAALVGGLAGPLAFYGGARLGGVVFVDATSALLALSVGWAVLLPVMIRVSTRLDGIATPGRRGRAHV